MIPNFFSLNSRKSEAYEKAFVKEVSVRRKIPRNRKVERMFIVCWILILLKSVLMLWLAQRHLIPFNPLWVIAPTFAAASLCTIVYWLRS